MQTSGRDDLVAAEHLQERYAPAIRAIHECPTKAVFYVTGGASQASNAQQAWRRLPPFRCSMHALDWLLDHPFNSSGIGVVALGVWSLRNCA